MEENYKRITATLILVLLVVLTFFVVRPILLAIISGIILAYVFSPIYNKLLKLTKSKDFSALLICVLLILIVLVPFWFLMPLLVEEAFKIYLASQQLDITTPLKAFFSSIFPSETFSTEVGSITYSFITNLTNSVVNSLSKLILNFPIILLQLTVVFFTLYFALRDKESLVSYIKSLLPFSEEVERKFFEASKGVASSVIYGQIIIGIIQGILAGIGFFIFGVPNPIFYTSLAILAGVLPIIGPAIVWAPIAFYLLVVGNSSAALGVLFFGILSSTIDNILRPLIVSKRTTVPSSIVIIGMAGGILVFGVLGLIIGPLILAYLLIVLELYRKKGTPVFKPS